MLTGSSRLGRTELGGSDPLAGRAARVRLWPMTQGELGGSPVTVIPALFADDPLTGGGTPISPADLQRRIARGGIPTIAGVRADVPDVVRPQLIAEYVEGVLHHETGRRHDRAELLRTYRYLAATTARLLNTSNVADDLGAKRETVQTRIATLDGSFLLHSLAARRSGEHRTLTAHPKVHVIDTSIAIWASRAGTEPPPELWGALVETFVVNELCAQAAWSTQQITVRHWRDTARKLEVDAVMAAPDGRAVGVEVKAGADVRPDDLKGLTALLADDEQIHRGVVFYTGAQVLQLSERIWAVPISALWEDPFDRGQ